MKTRILPSVLLLLFSAGVLEAAIEIVVQPRNQLVRPGAALTFEVLAHGSEPITYQWQRNGTNLSGATGTSLTFNNVQFDDGAYFSVVVSDGSDTLTSDRAFLIVTPTDPLDTWSVRVPQLASPVFGVAYGADRFVAVGGSSAWTSADGAVWATNTPPVGNLQEVAFGNGLFVACGSGIAISANGTNWSARPAGTTVFLNAVTWGNGSFVAVGGLSPLGSFATTSPDGVTWTPAPLPTNTSLVDVAFGNGQFVAVGENGRVLISPDGRNWTLRNSGTNVTLYGVVFGNGQFVAVGWPRLILTSPDAVNWIPRTNPAPSTVLLLGLTYGHGRFVAADYNGATLSSPDGVSWTLHPALPGVTLRNLAAGPDGFVAVGGMIVQSAPLVPAPPYIVTQPRSKAPLVGASYTLNVSASGMPPPAYQWRRNGEVLPGATSSNYTIASVQITNEGIYSVDVVNPFGSVASAPAEVVAGVPARFLQSPLSQEVVAGGSVTLSAVVTGRPPAFTYIWRYEGTSLRVTNKSSEPLTFHTYAAPSISATQRWRVVVSNEVTIGPGAISDYATVRVLDDSDGDGLPDEWESAFGFNPMSTGDGTNDFDLDGLSNAAEYIAGTNPTNATSVLRFESVESHGAAARLRFTAVANKTYTVQAKPVLDASPWQRVADVAATASARTVEVHDPFGGEGTSRFYRLVTPRVP